MEQFRSISGKRHQRVQYCGIAHLRLEKLFPFQLPLPWPHLLLSSLLNHSLNYYIHYSCLCNIINFPPQVEKSRLGLEGDAKIDIIDVKCDSDMAGLLTQTYGFLPGYHMNKKYWITMMLDGAVSEAKTLNYYIHYSCLCNIINFPSQHVKLLFRKHIIQIYIPFSTFYLII